MADRHTLEELNNCIIRTDHHRSYDAGTTGYPE